MHEVIALRFGDEDALELDWFAVKLHKLIECLVHGTRVRHVCIRSVTSTAVSALLPEVDVHDIWQVAYSSGAKDDALYRGGEHRMLRQ